MDVHALSLFHISDNPKLKILEPGYSRFIPRILDNNFVPVVDDLHLHQFLLPSNCPRVVFHPVEETSETYWREYRKQTNAISVLVLESSWLPYIGRTTLYIYKVHPDNFIIRDTHNGIYGSPVPVKPIEIKPVYNLLEFITTKYIEVRFTPKLDCLIEELKSSSLHYYVGGTRKQPPPVSETNFMDKMRQGT